MRTTTVGSMLALATALLVRPVGAAEKQETYDAHSRHAQTVIVLDNERIQPSNANVTRDGVLVFENQSVQPMLVRFVEPADAAQRVHCHFIKQAERREMEEKAPWLLFSMADGKLGATIPPGRFASLCAFAPGTYAFTAEPARVSSGSAGRGGSLGEKGQITVR
jgi:hypothetical protein